MQTVQPSTSSDTKKSEAKDKEAAKDKEEPPFEMVKNPCRAIQPQLKVVSMPEDSRYAPLKPVSTSDGINLSKFKIRYIYHSTSNGNKKTAYLLVVTDLMWSLIMFV